MLEKAKETCPHCGSSIDLSIDCSLEEQDFYEDCSQCGQPILINVRCTPDGDIENLELSASQ